MSRIDSPRAFDELHYFESFHFSFPLPASMKYVSKKRIYSKNYDKKILKDPKTKYFEISFAYKSQCGCFMTQKLILKNISPKHSC